MASKNAKLDMEKANWIRNLYRQEKISQGNVAKKFFEEFGIEIDRTTVNKIINNHYWIKRAKVAERTDGHRNDHAAKLAAAKDDIIEVPTTRKREQNKLKNVGYNLDF